MTLAQIADGMAKSVMIQKVKAKRHCKPCGGKGWALAEGKPALCDVCGGDGQGRYTLAERIDITGMKITPAGYIKTWELFERWAFSELSEWENKIRKKLEGLVRPLDSGI